MVIFSGCLENCPRGKLPPGQLPTRKIAPQTIALWMIAPGQSPQKQFPPDNIPLEIAAEENGLSDDLLPT